MKCRHCGEEFEDIEKHVKESVSVHGTKPSGIGEPWCGQHKCHPVDCWELHVVRSKVAQVETREEMNERIKRMHLEGQTLLTQCGVCGKFTKNMAEHVARRCVRRESAERG